MAIIGITHPVEDLPRFYTPEDLDRLRSVAEVVLLGYLDRGPWPAVLGQVDVLTGSWGMPVLTPEFLAAAPRLQAVAYAAGSVKCFATAEAFARGIRITSAAAANAIPVAETTVALITLAARHWFTCQAVLRQEGRAGYDRLRFPNGTWPGPGPVAEPPVIGSFGLTVGLIGFGAIARRVQERLLPQDIRTLVFDPYTPAEAIRAAGAEPVGDLLDLARQSQVVSLHAPDLPSTRGLCGAAFFAALPDGATFINTARGRLVDEDALIAELHRGRIVAHLDVTDPEPPVTGSPLYSLPNCWLTPHRAGSTGQEVRRLGRWAVEECLRFLAGEPPRYPVDARSLATGA